MDQLLRRYYQINLISIFGASILALAIFYIPLRNAFMSEANSRIERAMEIQTLRAQNVLGTIDRSVQALSSRSAIRFAMVEYSEGEVSLEELQEFVQRRYIDGAQVIEGVLATRRYLTDGTTIAFFNNPDFSQYIPGGSTRVDLVEANQANNLFFVPGFWDEYFYPPHLYTLDTQNLKISLSSITDVTELSLVFLANNPIWENNQFLGYDQVLVQKQFLSDVLPKELREIQLVSSSNLQSHIQTLPGLLVADIGQDIFLVAKPLQELYSLARTQALQSITVYTLMLFILIFSLVYVTVVQFVRRIISGYRQANDKMAQALETKELLLKEVHHRIKNNMNTISSLLSIQADMTEDQEAVHALETSVHRLQSLSILYDRLYQQNDFLHMDIKDYLTLLCHEVYSIFPNAPFIALNLTVDSGELKARQLSIVGIVVNELITNSMKHAFPHGTSGTITIVSTFQHGSGSKDLELDSQTPSATHEHQTNQVTGKNSKQVQSKLVLTYSDSGIGCDFHQDDLKLSETGSPKQHFGLQLIHILVRQLRGQIKTNKDVNQKGCSWTITIPLT